jgi:hypothetical protein
MAECKAMTMTKIVLTCWTNFVYHVPMTKHEITQKHFEALRVRFGSHSEAARRLGVQPSHYRYVRRTGKMSESLATLIQYLSEEQQAA